MNRITNLQKIMAEKHVPLIAITAGPDLYYLTGLDFHISERPIILLVRQTGNPHLVHPELESEKVKGCKFSLESYPYGEEKESWINVCAKALIGFNDKQAWIGVISTQIRYLEMELLHKACPNFSFVPIDEIVQKLRQQKDANELENIRKAIEIAEQAFKKTLQGVKPGRSEKEIAALLVLNLLQSGSDPDLPFSPIVASGPHSADPHAMTTDRTLKNGDLVVIDWGARYNHYISDLTRTISIGKPRKEFEKIARIINEANAVGREKAKEDILCSEIDKETRSIITKAGYGEFFMHRTGHGIGIEAHEAPFIAADYEQPLKIGNVFTIEPGIYLPKQGGVRIEDNVCVDEHGTETMSSLSRELFIIE